MVTDKKTGKLRRAQYRDIVILTRSIKGWADVYASVLAEEGIPAYAGSREGYFETYEVSVLLDYLKILDNMRQDLPLAAVLTSPFVGLNAQQLAEIKTAARAKACEMADDEKAHETAHETEDDEKHVNREISFMKRYIVRQKNIPEKSARNFGNFTGRLNVSGK